MEPPVSHDSKVGEDVSWLCKAHGKPIPHITWYKDDQPLDGQPTIKIKNSELSHMLLADSMLKIEKCDLESEEATYRVEAKNLAGKISHTFSLSGRYSHKHIPMMILFIKNIANMVLKLKQ